MSIEGLCSNGEDNVWLIVDRKEQQQPGCMANAFDGKPWRPVPPRPRRHQRVSRRAREVAFQSNLEALQSFSKRQAHSLKHKSLVGEVSSQVLEQHHLRTA